MKVIGIRDLGNIGIVLTKYFIIIFCSSRIPRLTLPHFMQIRRYAVFHGLSTFSFATELKVLCVKLFVAVRFTVI